MAGIIPSLRSARQRVICTFYREKIVFVPIEGHAQRTIYRTILTSVLCFTNAFMVRFIEMGFITHSDHLFRFVF